MFAHRRGGRRNLGDKATEMIGCSGTCNLSLQTRLADINVPCSKSTNLMRRQKNLLGQVDSKQDASWSAEKLKPDICILQCDAAQPSQRCNSGQAPAALSLSGLGEPGMSQGGSPSRNLILAPICAKPAISWALLSGRHVGLLQGWLGQREGRLITCKLGSRELVERRTQGVTKAG